MARARGLVTVAWIALAGIGCAQGNDADRSGSSGAMPWLPDDGSSSGSSSGDIGPGDDGCSDDLRDVVDSNGTVIETCPPDQGCLDGKCVPACDAAGGNKGNVGCDFLVSTPLFLPYTTQPCFAAFVANTWPESVHIEVAYDGQKLDVSQFGRIPDGSPDPSGWPMVPATGLPPDQVAVLFLSSDPYSSNAGTSLACPVQPALGYSTAISGTGRGSTFSIRTDVPVSVYDILPFGGARSYLPGAELVLPVTAWGKNYVPTIARVQFYPEAPFLSGAGGPMWTQIVAGHEQTTVEVQPKHFAGFPAGTGVAAAPGGATTSFTLAPGESLQWSGMADPSGSILLADKPIALMTGNGELCQFSATSPSGGGCDSAHAQIPPVSALGFDYAVAPHTTRRADLEEESILYRIVGAVAGTVLTFDPPLPGVPSTLGVGEFVDFEAMGAFRVQSQDADHPFSLAQFMVGGLVEGGTRPGVTPGAIEGGQLGDEDFVIVLPPQQYQSRYVFFTDPTYATTNLVLVRVATPDGFRDVEVDCLGVVDGWKPVGQTQQFEYTEVDLMRVQALGSCTNGRHVASSEGRFGLVVWGLDAWASYAYPAGAAVAPINEVVVVPEPK